MTTSPLFDTQKEALAWLVPDAIEGAVEPFLGLVGSARIADLRDLLADAAATHPRMRTLATRAAKTFVRVVEKPLAEAAREDEAPKKVPIAPAPKELALPHPVGANLADPALYGAAERVINSLARHLGKKWRYEVEELVGAGWIVAVEISHGWDHTQGMFETYLWRCARSRMLDKVNGAAHRREKPFGYYYSDTMHKNDGDDESSAEKCFRDSMKSFATSQIVGSLMNADPEEMVAEQEARARVVEAVRELDEKHRPLMEKILVEGMGLVEARKALKLPETTARLLQKEALVSIRASLAKGSNVRPLRPRPKR